MQGEIKDFYTYPFGGRHPVFNRQEVFQKRNSHKNLAIKMIVLAKKGKKTQRLTGLLTGFDFLKVEFVATELELLKKAERTKIDLVLILGFENNLTGDESKNLSKKELVKKYMELAGTRKSKQFVNMTKKELRDGIRWTIKNKNKAKRKSSIRNNRSMEKLKVD